MAARTRAQATADRTRDMADNTSGDFTLSEDRVLRQNDDDSKLWHDQVVGDGSHVTVTGTGDAPRVVGLASDITDLLSALEVDCLAAYIHADNRARFRALEEGDTVQVVPATGARVSATLAFASMIGEIAHFGLRGVSAADWDRVLGTTSVSFVDASNGTLGFYLPANRQSTRDAVDANLEWWLAEAQPGAGPAAWDEIARVRELASENPAVTIAASVISDRSYGDTGVAATNVLSGTSGSARLVAPAAGFLLISVHNWRNFEGNVTWREAADLRTATASDALHLASTGQTGILRDQVDIYTDSQNRVIFKAVQAAGNLANDLKLTIWHVQVAEPSNGGGGPTDLSAVIQRIDGLEHLTADMRPPDSSTGWQDQTSDAQGGIALRSGGAFSLSQARSATYSRAPADPGGKWAAVWLSTATDPAQARLHFTGVGGEVFDLPISSINRLGGNTASNPTRWLYGIENAAIGDRVASIKLQFTGSAAHIGTSAFLGRLARSKVYDLLKLILPDRIPNDGAEVLTPPPNPAAQARFGDLPAIGGSAGTNRTAQRTLAVQDNFDINMPAGAFSVDSGTFKLPAAGVYRVSAQVTAVGQQDNARSELTMRCRVSATAGGTKTILRYRGSDYLRGAQPTANEGTVYMDFFHEFSASQLYLDFQIQGANQSADYSIVGESSTVSAIRVG